MQTVVLVAHGQPSDPAAAAAELDRFAAAVAGHLAGYRVRAATLSLAGAMETAVLEGAATGLVFPLFMAGGWFARVHLPARLKAAGAPGWSVLEPFGCDRALHDLAATVVAEALRGHPGALLLAAHGSGKTTAPADIAHHVAAGIGARLGLRRAEAAFIDQHPRLSTMTGFTDAAVCLPFFAAAGGHVQKDIPAALAEAGFAGRLLPPLGLDARVPGLVAAAIRRATPICAGACRFSADNPAGQTVCR